MTGIFRPWIYLDAYALEKALSYLDCEAEDDEIMTGGI
jgi:hypothetical protein